MNTSLGAAAGFAPMKMPLLCKSLDWRRDGLHRKDAFLGY